MFLHTFSPHSILAHFGPFTIHWYGLFLSLGALAGYLVLVRLGKRYGLKGVDMENLFFLTVIAGLIGARLYHVLNEWGYYTKHPSEIMSIWNGGLAIHGGLIAGLAVLVMFARRKKISFWLLADITVPAVAIGQAIGRWGNYFNQELFGKPTSLPWGIPIEQLNRPPLYLNDTYFHPTFLYEFLGSLAVFIVLMLLHRRRLAIATADNGNATVPKTVGVITLVYFMSESIVRIATESLRIDKVPYLFNVRLPLIVSIVIAITAAVLLVRIVKKRTS